MRGFGFFTNQIEKKVLKIRKEEDHISGIIKALERRGYDDDEIERILTEAGFNSKKIEKILDFLEK